ncbi:MAG TPA: hypothetical protein VKJ65_05465, partial [Phycisphaerae bacterium]|nr:hypothetical protein [Phycisphaerae bacterium]
MRHIKWAVEGFRRRSVYLLLLFLATVSGCSETGEESSPARTAFNLQGWTQQSSSGNGLVTTGKLNGTVGTYFDANLKVLAVAPDGSSPGYSCSNGAFVFGTMPPGLSWGSNASIVGTPTTAGDWNFGVRFTGIQCNGENFPDQTVYGEIIIAQ